MKIRRILMIFFVVFFVLFINGSKDSKDLIASLAQLPGLVDSPDKGAFVDLVKAIDEVYTNGTIKIEVYPFARSVNNVITGKADFHIPSLRNPVIPESKLPYRFVTEKMGLVRFVIYSHGRKIITKKMIDDAIAKGGNFPYKFEVPAGLEDNFAFPVIPSNDLPKSFQKVDGQRIDAILWAQEESDLVLRELKLKTIHREFWDAFDDVIIIQKGAKSDLIDKILSDALKELKKSGRLDRIYSKIHRPFDDWQP
jgi:polar amino acid transport system substrate-binding protein